MAAVRMMVPLRLILLVGTMVFILQSSSILANTHSQDPDLQTYWNDDGGGMAWDDDGTEERTTLVFDHPIPPFGEVEVWMQRQLAHPVNWPLTERLLVDLKNGMVDKEYWEELLERLKVNEKLVEEQGEMGDEYDEMEEEDQGIEYGEEEGTDDREEDWEDDQEEENEVTSEEEERNANAKSIEEEEDTYRQEEERQEEEDEEEGVAYNEGLEDEDIDEELLKELVKDFDFQLSTENGEQKQENEEQEIEEQKQGTFHRLKRSPAARRTSSSRRSGSSSSSRRRTSSTGTSGGTSGGGWGWGSSSRNGSSSGSRGSSTRISSTRPTGNTNTRPSYGTSSGGVATGTGVATSSTIGNKPPAGWNVGGAGTGAARPGNTYPTNTNPQYGYPGSRPGSTYPTGTNPQAGFPGAARPGSTYPTGTNPQAGYPGAARPGGTYPTGTNPQAGYPGAARPGGTYPTGTNPQAGYPGAVRPGGTYPTGTNPQAGYPGARPGYPGSTYPQPGYPGMNAAYPTGRQPFGSYPMGNQPYYGGSPSTGHQSFGGFNSYGQPRNSYTGAFQPYGGFPTSTRHMGYGAAAAAGGGMMMMGASRGFGGYPVGGYPMPVKKKKGLKNKIKAGIAVGVAAYAIHKITKKNKFLSPSHFGSYGHGYGMGGGYGGYGGMGGFGHRGFGGMGGMGGMGGFGHRGLGMGLGAGLAGMAIAKTGKMLLGAYVKIQIAKYALKFGAEAAKAYFMYKMGLQLDDYMVGKFVHRYHQSRVVGDNRWRNYYHHSRRRNGANLNNSTNGHDNITLGEFCRRPCVENDTRICQFSFDVHLYQSMSRACYDCPRNKTDCERPECVLGDGTRRMVLTVNKAIPGPRIEVCVGDKVLVDVMNNHPSTSVSLHWHGLTMGPTLAMPHARPTPFMDGTIGVTQCSIPPGSGFRYAFFASNPGTHFWRAQTGLERGDGLYGPLIVHQSVQKDPNQFFSEHIILISDWFHKSQAQLWSQRQTSGSIPIPKALLINGRGAKVKAGDEGTPSVPPARVMVQNGTRYRLRVMNTASSNCPVTLSIASHDLVILALDGAPVSPVNVTTILLHPGDRYDAMFSAEAEVDDEGTSYWIRVSGGGDCSDLYQYAALQYLPTNYSLEQELPTLPPIPSPIPTTSQAQFTGGCDVPGQRCLTHLTSSIPMPDALQVPRAAHTFYLALTHSLVLNPHYYNLLYYDGSNDKPDDLVSTPQINYLSYRPPPKPLLSNPRPLRSDNCSAEAVRVSQCTVGYCECVHVLTVPLGSTVDLVFIADVSLEDVGEPVHLHGYTFRVLSQVAASDLPPDPPTPAPPTPPTLPPDAAENATTPAPPPPPPPPSLRDKVVEWDKREELVRGLKERVQKDTVLVPPGGYTIVRFTADNPGVWLLESEVLFQSQAGMALILRVGDTKDVPSNPPPDQPTC